MATRRSLGLGGEREDDFSSYGEENYDQPVGTSIVDLGGLDQLFGLSGQSPQAGDPFGTQPVDPMEPIDRSQPMAPGDMGRDSDREGSSERPREFMPSTAPTTYAAPQPGPESYGIPEGVSVAPDAFSGVPDSSNAMVTPMSPQSPAPAVMSGQPPGIQAGEAGSGPQRRTITSSAPSRMFSPRRQSALLGGAGGLNEGGLGVPGSGGGGPVQPTELMKALMAALRTG